MSRPKPGFTHHCSTLQSKAFLKMINILITNSGAYGHTCYAHSDFNKRPASWRHCSLFQDIKNFEAKYDSSKEAIEIGLVCEGSPSHHVRRHRALCYGWPLEKGIPQNRKEQSKLITEALPTTVTAAATVLAVGGAIFALTKLSKDSTPVFVPKKECEVCGGSGLCSACNGEGFVNKNLSAEAAAKARDRAKDAATRYTAGLAKKWNYCTTCSGQRGCQSCEGRGWIDSNT